jgi:hypothetical protein
VTPLQEKFLFGVFIYYIFKGSIFVTLYVALIIVEKHARERQKQIRIYLKRKRANERERWKVAYNLYEKQQEIPAASAPAGKPLSQLINNPHSFTAYSTEQERWKVPCSLHEKQQEIPASRAPAAKSAAKPAAKPLDFCQLATMQHSFTA